MTEDRMLVSPSAPVDIRAALAWARSRIDLMEARSLLRHVLQCSTAQLVAWPERSIDADRWAAFRALVERRAAGEPLAYLRGECEFYGRDFQVTPAVLIPRADSELLIELALAHFPGRKGLRILDLGTGSGVLAVTLALELENAEVVALDRSRPALLVALANAARLGARVSLVQSDWFDALEPHRFDLIVANPPYIAAGDPHLEQGDLRFEPPTALVSGPAGLDDLAQIVAHAPFWLEDGGWLLVEHGYDQGAALRGLLLDAGFAGIRTWQDLGGNDRVSGGRWRARQ